jgi:hypothetical protein
MRSCLLFSLNRIEDSFASSTLSFCCLICRFVRGTQRWGLCSFYASNLLRELTCIMDFLQVVFWCWVSVSMQVVWHPNDRDICQLVWNSWIQGESIEHTKYALGACPHVCGISNPNVDNLYLSVGVHLEEHCCLPGLSRSSAIPEKEKWHTWLGILGYTLLFSFKSICIRKILEFLELDYASHDLTLGFQHVKLFGGTAFFFFFFFVFSPFSLCSYIFSDKIQILTWSSQEISAWIM